MVAFAAPGAVEHHGIWPRSEAYGSLLHPASAHLSEGPDVAVAVAEVVVARAAPPAAAKVAADPVASRSQAFQCPLLLLDHSRQAEAGPHG